MVGKAEPQAVPKDLAPLWWQGTRRLSDLEITGEQVVDRARFGRTVKPEAPPQRLEGSGVHARPQVEVAAEEQRRIASPFGRRRSGPQYIGRRHVGPVVGRVQVGDAELTRAAECDASKRHRPPLRPPFMDRQFPPLHHSEGSSHQG